VRKLPTSGPEATYLFSLGSLDRSGRLRDTASRHPARPRHHRRTCPDRCDASSRHRDRCRASPRCSTGRTPRYFTAIAVHHVSAGVGDVEALRQIVEGRAHSLSANSPVSLPPRRHLGAAGHVRSATGIGKAVFIPLNFRPARKAQISAVRFWSPIASLSGLRHVELLKSATIPEFVHFRPDTRRPQEPFETIGRSRGPHLNRPIGAFLVVADDPTPAVNMANPVVGSLADTPSFHGSRGRGPPYQIAGGTDRGRLP